LRVILVDIYKFSAALDLAFLATLKEQAPGYAHKLQEMNLDFLSVIRCGFGKIFSQWNVV
jgi:hypothetical protein